MTGATQPSRPDRHPLVVVVTAGLSQPSSTRLLADRLASATVTALGPPGQAAVVEVVELREWAHDLTNHLLTGFPSPSLRDVLDSVAAADALIAVSPIFSASYSGLFKMFFDVVEPGALDGTPVLIGATGGSARHSLALEHALRPLFSYLRATVVPTGVYAATEDWAAPQLRDAGTIAAGGAHSSELTARIDRAAGELARLVRPGRPEVQQPDDEHDPEVVPFSRLLAAQRAAAGQRFR
jgi:FMN reductase